VTKIYFLELLRASELCISVFAVDRIHQSALGQKITIKRHSDVRSNDAADELARKGAHRKPIGPEPILLILTG
jgi:hypothetical protein